MGQRKTILFLGRRDYHMGYEYCRKLCRRQGWKLIVAAGGRTDVPALIDQADAVFTTGYLGIVEAWSRGKIVLAHYNSPVKKDYLLMHPLAKYLVLDGQPPDKLPQEPYRWAKVQTWDKVTDLYEQLWRK